MEASTITPLFLGDNQALLSWLSKCLEDTPHYAFSPPLAVPAGVALEGERAGEALVAFLDLTPTSISELNSRLQSERPALPDCPLIALVATPEAGRASLQGGADDYLVVEESDGATLARVLRYVLRGDHAPARQITGGDGPVGAERLRHFLENAPDIILVLDLDTQGLTYINREELFGFYSDEFRPPGAIYGFIHPEDQPAVRQRWQRRPEADDGQVFRTEFRMRSVKGDWEWVQSREKLLAGKDGNGPGERLVSLSVITQRKERESSVRRYAERLQILHGIDQAIVAARSPQAIAEATLRRSSRLISCQRASVALFNWEADTFTVLAELPSGNMGAYDTTSLPLSWYWAAEALKQGEIYREPDLQNLAPEERTPLADWLLGQGMRSFVSVPLRAQGELVGALNFGASEAGSFSAEDVVVMREVAHVLAIAIAQARLYEQAHYHARKLEQRAKRLLLVNDISLSVNRPVKVNAVLEVATKGLVTVIDIRRASIILLNEARDTWTLCVTHSARSGAAIKEVTIPVFDRQLLQQLWQSDSFLFMENAAGDPRLENLHSLLMERKSNNLVLVPLQVRDEVIGAIGCDIGPGKRNFSDEETDLIQTIANLLSVKLEHIRLLEAERAARGEAEAHAANLRLRERHLTVLNAINRATTSLETEEMLQTVVNRLGEMSSADGCRITLWDKGQESMLTMAVYGRENGTRSGQGAQAWEDVLTREVLEAEAPVRIGDVNNAPQLSSMKSDLVFDSALAIPLLAGKEKLGALIVSFDARQQLTQSEINLFEQAAGQIALALSVASLFEETRRRAEELEVLTNLSAELRVADGTDEIIDIVLTSSAELFQGEAVSIAVPGEDPNTLVLAHEIGVPQGVKGKVYHVNDSIFGHVFSSGKAYRSPDILSDRLAHSEAIEEWREEYGGPQTAIYAPLRAGTEISGIVAVVAHAGETLESDDLRLLQAMAEIAGSALQRAGLMETLEQRVEERTRELAEANEQLKELDRLKSKFVSDVSHELRTPITSLSLYMDLIDRAGTEHAERYWGVLRKQTERLNELIEDILSLSRLQLGKVDLTFAPLNLNALLEKLLDAHREEFEAASLSLVFHPDQQLPPVLGQPERLTEAISNVLLNALHYTTEGQVRVSTYGDDMGEMACVCVQDSGVGIDEEDLPHIFERFYRGNHAGQSNIPGTGLGLTIVEEIVSLHNGHIEVESEGREGTTFRIWLPLAEGG